MQEDPTFTPKETNNPVPFKEKKLSGLEPARCVDGRPATESPQGPQMLGGSLHPILLSAIANGRDFDEETVKEGLNTLQSKRFKTGVHRGAHAHGEKSDCGFADGMKGILLTVLQNRREITQRLIAYCSEESLNSAFAAFGDYDANKIQLTGKDLIQTAVNSGASIETVEGDHAEEVAFVNLKPGVTFDTKAINSKGQQAFNLDLKIAIEQAQALGVDAEFARTASLILYQATEMVLVENKGKEALPVKVHQ